MAHEDLQQSGLKETVPTCFVIFGATGDLARKKLFKALFDLFRRGFLPSKFYIIAFSRRQLEGISFGAMLKEMLGINENFKDDATKFKDFLGHVFYQQGFFDEISSYKTLGEKLAGYDLEWNICSNKLFYLAVPPSHYENIFKHLSNSGLTIPCVSNTGWTRVLVEKPFGNDLATAIELDKKLGALFSEEQIFRIDHYLAKETIQNILAFRFSNAIFEPIWNNKYIEKVEITLVEKKDIEGRAEFYDPLGALRDVGQNHLLMMLSLIAMEEPKFWTATDIQHERAKALKSLVPIPDKNIRKFIWRGQYDGYKENEKISTDSTTETAFKIETHVGSKRFKGVPFYLKSGKALSENKTEIKIFFKGNLEHNGGNVLTFGLSPNPGITISFFVKKPGFEGQTELKNLSFLYENSHIWIKLPDAYERVLFDCIRGDQTLFASTEEVKASWEFITPILDKWKKVPLDIYKKGDDI